MKSMIDANLEDTPVVLVDRDRLCANMSLVQDKAARYGVKVRPHVKTHKCLEIARLQLDNGAIGITASKVDEALVFINAGFPSVTLAYPIVEAVKLDRLLTAARSVNASLNLIADSFEGVEILSHAALRHGMILNVLIKIDVGLGRCGLKEDDPRLTHLAMRINQDKGLRFEGILSHAGHAYGAGNREDVLRIAREELAILFRVRRMLEMSGLDVREVSAGSTPTVLAADDFQGLTEIRPGNYVFMDRTPLRLGFIEVEQVALTVLTTIVSANSEHYIIDAGSKTLSSDLGAQGSASVKGYGMAFPGYEHPSTNRSWLEVTRLSEEHGFISRGGTDLRVGSKLRIVPNHSCTVANLAEKYLAYDKNGAISLWDVAARSKVK